MATRQDILDFINSLPKERQEKMKRLQWRIDQELAKCKDPTQRFNRMVEMLYESVGRFHLALTEPSKLLSKKAEVIEFKKHN